MKHAESILEWTCSGVGVVKVFEYVRGLPPGVAPIGALRETKIRALSGKAL